MTLYRLVSSTIWPRMSSSRKVDKKLTGWGLLGRKIRGPVGSSNVSSVGAVSVSVSADCHGMVLEQSSFFSLHLSPPSCPTSHSTTAPSSCPSSPPSSHSTTSSCHTSPFSPPTSSSISSTLACTTTPASIAP